MWKSTQVVIVTLLLYSSKAERKTLNIMGLFSVTGQNWPGGGACLPAAEMAIRHLNDRDDIFPNFKLNMIWRDGKVRVILIIYKYVAQFSVVTFYTHFAHVATDFSVTGSYVQFKL